MAIEGCICVSGSGNLIETITVTGRVAVFSAAGIGADHVRLSHNSNHRNTHVTERMPWIILCHRGSTLVHADEAAMAMNDVAVVYRPAIREFCVWMDCGDICRQLASV